MRGVILPAPLPAIEMFKKEQQLAERSRSLLKNKEVRTLRSAVLVQYPLLTEDLLNTVLPNKANVTAIKLANRTLLYSIDDVVLFFDVEGRNILFPTVHALWRCPGFLRTFTCHGPASRYILRGADFMTPGLATIEGLDNLKVGERCCLKIRGNPLPFAVGESLIDFSAFTRTSHALKGKAMSIMHVYGDLLADKAVPNAGFSFQEIRPLGAEGKPLADDDDDDASSSEEEALEQQTDGAEADIVEDMHVLDISAEQAEAAEHDPSLPLPVTEEDDEADADESVDDSPSTLTTEQVDALLQRSLSLALRYIVKEAHLPILASKLWALMLRCHTAAAEDAHEEQCALNIKRSSSRKVKSFLEVCKAQGLLEVVTSENGITQILSINRNHPACSAHKVNDVDAFKAFVNHTSTMPDAATAGAGQSAGSGGGGKSTDKLSIIELWKLPKKMRDIFGNVQGTFGELLRANELKDMLVEYMKAQNLAAEGSKQMLCLQRESHRELFEMLSSSAKAVAITKPVAIERAAEVFEEEVEDISSDPSMAALRAMDTAAAWPRLRGTGADIGLKISKAGLINLDDPSSTPVVPPSSSTANKAKNSKAWKPVSLPPAPPAPAGNKKLPVGHPGSASQHQNASKKKPAVEVEEVPEMLISKEDFVKGCVSKMTPYHAIMYGGEAEIFSGTVPKVHILAEKRQGNKMVTIVRGVEHFGLDLADLAKKFQKR